MLMRGNLDSAKMCYINDNSCLLFLSKNTELGDNGDCI